MCYYGPCFKKGFLQHMHAVLRIVWQQTKLRNYSVSKKTSLTTSNSPGFFGELWRQAKLVFQLILDPKVPFYLKFVPFAAIAYLLFPFDFLPDVIPGLGQLDDITILLIGAKIFIELAPQDVVAQYLDRLRSPGETEDLGSAPENGGEENQDGDDIIEGIIIDEDELDQ